MSDQNCVDEDRVQGYGLTETNAYVCSIAGQDYVKRVSLFENDSKVADTLMFLARQHVRTKIV